MPGEGIATFAAAATRLAAGDLTVTPAFDAPDGLRSATMLRAVEEGRVQSADAFTGALASTAPIFQLSALPFLTASAADTARLLAAARPAYEAALAAHGATLLYATPWPASGIWSRHPLAPDSLNGLKIRTYDAASTAVLRGAGAMPAQISFADAGPRLPLGRAGRRPLLRRRRCRRPAMGDPAALHRHRLRFPSQPRLLPHRHARPAFPQPPAPP